MFEGFRLEFTRTAEAVIRLRVGGKGVPLLLLHGHPQTHFMWHGVASLLALDFTVVASDLRGYGDSSKPPTTTDHEPYSKRAMARDQIAVMRSLGFDSFFVAGHDRGGRVAYRMALDYPDRVEKLAVLDIVPTAEAFRSVDMRFALKFWTWFFLAQPHPIPETIIGRDPDLFFFNRVSQGEFGTCPSFLLDEPLSDYLRCYRNPATIHSACEDYRAGATIDLEHDEEDCRRGASIRCPTHVLWSTHGELHEWYDVLDIWRRWCTTVTGRGMNCGHFMAEEAPQDTAAALRAFFLRG